jgi:hypothetical protein
MYLKKDIFNGLKWFLAINEMPSGGKLFLGFE